MGFRSQLLSTYLPNPPDWPSWFREKHPLLITPAGQLGVLTEVKTYSQTLSDLPGDVDRALQECGWWDAPAGKVFTLVWLHECDGVTKVVISPDRPPRFMRVEQWGEIPPDSVDPQTAGHEQGDTEPCAKEMVVQLKDDGPTWILQ